MSIIMDENRWAEDMIASHNIGRKPVETLRRVARYYMDAGYDAGEVRRRVEAFLIGYNPLVSLPLWQKTIDTALSNARRYKAIRIDYVWLTQGELDKINHLKGKQLRRLAFTLLCLSKYWKQVNPLSNYWVRTEQSEVMALANINTSIKRQDLMYHSLSESGLIQLARRADDSSVRVCFAEDVEDTSNEVVLRIEDFRQLGWQYLLYRGEPFFRCAACGTIAKYNDPRNKRGQKYCKECAAKIKARQCVEAARRAKARAKQEN